MVTQDEIEAAIVAVGEAISNGDNASEVALAALEAASRIRWQRLNNTSGGKQSMTTARDVIAEWFVENLGASNGMLDRLLSAPDSVRQELVALFDASDQKCDRRSQMPSAGRTAPMTDDIAGLIERARAWAGNIKGEYSDEGERYIIDLCAALLAPAQENERLLQSLNMSHELELRERIAELEAERDRLTEIAKVTKERYRQFDDENGQLQARIKELEAERDALKEECDTWKEEYGKLLDDTADYISDSAIRAKTIEECAKVAAERWGSGVLIAKAIRALAQTDEVVHQGDYADDSKR